MGCPPLTLLMAMRADDGIAAVSDRKASLSDHTGREVTKCHLDAGGRFYLSLSGDGRTAKAILDHIRAAGPSGISRKISDLAAAMHEEYQLGASVDGILVVAGVRGLEMSDIYIRGGQTHLYVNDDASSVHGDYAATVLCRHITKSLDARALSCDAVAAHLHVLASSVAETVDSVGKREEYGFDLAVIDAAGGPVMLWRQAGALGTLEVRFRTSGTGRSGRRPGGASVARG